MSRLEYLFYRYYRRTCTEEEEAELMEMMRQKKNDAELKRLIDRLIVNAEAEHTLPGDTADKILAAILEHKPASARRMRLVIKQRRILAAACVVVLIASTFVWYIFRKPEKAPVYHAARQEILPGTERAELILGDGSAIDLEKVKSGRLDRQEGTFVDKEAGQLRYDKPAAGNTQEVSYNTVKTPYGGQYHVVLPDGSQAWLNAGSSLHFPTAFTGEVRQVEVSGEVYFEVRKSLGKAMPFRVKVGNKAEVEVLGTHFNINAYPDEAAIRTTLLEGIVMVSLRDQNSKKQETNAPPRLRSTRGNKKLLKPGQQAVMNTRDNRIEISPADLNQAVAWKEGRFEFNGNIKEIMRQIARWYDVEVQYEGDVENKAFIGAISRKEHVSDVLKMLELTGGIRFKIAGRKVLVMPSGNL